MAAPDPQVWPVSIAGWVALALSIVALIGVVFGWGKLFGKLDRLIGVVARLEGSVENLDDRFTLMEHILVGPLKNNGLVSKVEGLNRRVDLIQDRNTRLDAIRAREEGAQQAGVESRLQLRRREDKIIHGEEE